MIIGSHIILLGDFINSRIPLFVRNYQRGYAWEAEEVDDFVKDFRRLYEARLRDESSSEVHFFGGLVLIDHYPVSTRTGHRYEIVDGQQRLATFFLTNALIIHALENLAAQARHESNEETEGAATENARLEQDELLFYREREGAHLHSRLRLTLSKADRVFFEQLIRAGGVSTSVVSRASHQRLKDAAERIRTSLVDPILADTTIATSDKLERLLSLISCVRVGCQMLEVVSDDRNEAYKLFRVLNDRGRTLSDGDLLRARTLEQLENFTTLQEQVESYWDTILADPPTEIERFLRSYYPSNVGERAPKLNLADYFTDHFFDYPAPISLPADAEAMERRVANMKAESALHSLIADGQWPYYPTEVSTWDRDRLSRLVKTLKHSLCVPLLLSASSRLSEETSSGLVNVLERFVFRYITVVSAHPMRVADRYYNHAVRIRNEGNSYRLNDLVDDLRGLLSRHAQHSLFEFSLKEKLNYKQQEQRRVIRHFLTTLEDYSQWYKDGASGNPRADKTRSYDLNEINIEHIYPRNPDTPVAGLEPLKDDIGNLTFWAPRDNQAASNDPFDAKKAKYARSNIRLTRDLADLPKWDKATLDERRNELIRMASKVFTL